MASASYASGSISCGMTPEILEHLGARAGQPSPQIEGQIRVDPAAQLAEPLVRRRAAAADEAARREHRVAQRLGDQQVAAPLDLLRQPGEAPRREADRGQQEEARRA